MLAFLQNDAAIDAAYTKCLQQISKLKEYIKQLQKDKFPINHALQHRANAAKDDDELYKLSTHQFENRCSYSHFGKIWAIDFSKSSDQIVSSGSDGKLLICDTNNAKGRIAIPLRGCSTLDCSFSPNGKCVATGGWDNLCTIYNIKDSIGWDVNHLIL